MVKVKVKTGKGKDKVYKNDDTEYKEFRGYFQSIVFKKIADEITNHKDTREGFKLFSNYQWKYYKAPYFAFSLQAGCF